METSAVPAAPGAIRVTFRQAGRVNGWTGWSVAAAGRLWPARCR